MYSPDAFDFTAMCALGNVGHRDFAFGNDRPGVIGHRSVDGTVDACAFNWPEKHNAAAAAQATASLANS